jgi:hypothetical protein
MTTISRASSFLVLAISAILLFLAVPKATAQSGDSAAAFIETLSDAQRTEAVHPINDPERFDWTYFPGIRGGVRLGDLDEGQRSAFRAFFETALSPQGMRRIDTLRKVEAVSDRGRGVKTGADEYWIRFYGDPGSRVWAWRLEGHHLVVNAAIVDGRVVSISPLFFGSAPVSGSEKGPKEVIGVEPLRAEDEAAMALLANLGPIERAMARSMGPVPGDIRSGTSRTAQLPPEAGVTLAKMNETQRALVQSIVDGYLGTWPEDARKGIAERFAAADPTTVRFATAGPDKREQPHYWRITSPVLIIEYFNGRAGANHAHVVLRTLHGEFPEL